MECYLGFDNSCGIQMQTEVIVLRCCVKLHCLRDWHMEMV